MARRRRRQNEEGAGLAALLLLLMFVFVSKYPWIIAVALVIGGGYAYWRWWYIPRREQEHQLAQHERAREALRERSQTLGGFLTLTPREFEKRIADLLAQHGYEDIEHVGRTGDLGIDIFATDPNGDQVGVQCKRYALEKPVRAPEVRLLYGDMTHAGVRGVLVTTSDYTADARAYAESHGINLINGDRLMQLLSAAPD